MTASEVACHLHARYNLPSQNKPDPRKTTTNVTSPEIQRNAPEAWARVTPKKRVASGFHSPPYAARQTPVQKASKGIPSLPLRDSIGQSNIDFSWNDVQKVLLLVSALLQPVLLFLTVFWLRSGLEMLSWILIAYSMLIRTVYDPIFKQTVAVHDTLVSRLIKSITSERMDFPISSMLDMISTSLVP